MQEKSLAFSEVFDIYGFRVVVRDQPSCYLALGALHSLYKPIPGKFKDYIAIPKANGYQSLHSILFGPNGTPIEVQIRTTDMNRLAESGVASHWMYKSADAALSDVQTRTHRWLQSLLDIQADHGDSPEFLEHIKVDLFPDEVYVFTPKGKIMAMPRGATAVDFAFAVHTDVGRHCVAVKINYELMPLRTQLRNGDHVEILTAANASPNAAWLNFVVTGRARSHIRNYLRNTRVEEAAALGERLLNNALAALNPEAGAPDPAVWERVVKDYGVQTRQELFAGIGLGRKLPLVVAHQLLHVQGEKSGIAGPSPRHQHSRLRRHRGRTGAVLPPDSRRPHPRLHPQGSRPHHPHPRLPLDPHLPRRSRQMAGRGMGSRSRAACSTSQIKVVVGNQRGVLAKVAAAIAEHGSNIGNVAMEEEDGSPYTILFFTVQVENRMHLARVMRGLRDAARRGADFPHQGQEGRPRHANPIIPTATGSSMNKSIIQTADAPAAIGTYSQAVRVDHTVYLSGQIGLDPASMQLVDGIDAQIHQVFKNLAAVASAAGGSLADVVKLNVFLIDLGALPQGQRNHGAVFRRALPGARRRRRRSAAARRAGRSRRRDGHRIKP